MMVGDEKYCCGMRRHFVVGIIAQRQGEDPPVDLADFVVAWEPKIAIRIKYCPFCGEELPDDDTLRMQG